MRVGCAAEPGVVAATPIDGVQLAFVTRLGPIGNLVIHITCGAQNVVDDVIFIGLVIVIRMPRGLISQHRTRFDRQPVSRHVWCTECHYLLHCCCPVVERLACPAVHHVEIERGETSCGDGVDCADHIVG